MPPPLSPVPILMYHRLGKVRRDSTVPGHYVRPKQFESHLKLLRALRYQPVLLSTLHAGWKGKATLPQKPVVLTFDDGYRSFLEIGVPTLERFGFGATVFLVSSLLGGTNRWDQSEGDVEEELLSKDEIEQCLTKGHEFGSHTARHARLGDCSPEDALSEIEGSKASLEETLGREINYFCYPYGSQNDRIRAMVKNAGYRGATSTRKGANQAETDPFNWGRLNVRSTTSSLQLALKLWRAKVLNP